MTPQAQQFEVVDEPPLLVAATTRRTVRSGIAEQLGAGFTALQAELGRQGVPVTGPPLVVYLEPIHEEAAGDLEVCLPVAGTVTEAPPVHARELAGGPMATALHRGPYTGLAAVYDALFGWVRERGHEVVGPPREVYLNDPQAVPAQEILTRVQVPVRPAG